MTYIYVDKSKFRNFSSSCRDVSRNLGKIKSEFYSAASSLDWEIKDSAGIDRRIKNLNNNLQERIEKIGRIQNFLEYAYGEYDKLDSQSLKLLENIEGASKATKRNESVFKWVSKAPKAVYKVLKKVKFIGPIVTLSENLYNVAENDKTYGGFDRSTFIGEAGNIAAVTKDAVSIFNDFDKFKKAFQEPTGGKIFQLPKNIYEDKGFLGKLKENVGVKGGNLNIGKVKGINAGKLLGNVLDIGLTIGENFTNEESKNQSSVRNLSEGVVESLIKIGKGVVVSSVVGATIGLTGPLGLLAVAGATVATDCALDMGTNMIVSKIKGEKYKDGFVECVSDTLINTIVSTADVVSSTGKYLQNVVGGNYKNATYKTKMQYA